MSQAARPVSADFAINHACLLTMDGERRVIRDGALAVKGNRIVWVGQAADLEAFVKAKAVIDGSRFVISPGFINGHVHVTGDPLTRNFMADDVATETRLMTWVIPRYHAQSADDEKLSAKLAAIELLKGGTTTFIEAGTIRHLDAAVAGLRETGIRARVGDWVEGRAFDPSLDACEVEGEAIRILQNEVGAYPQSDDALISAWPVLVGHQTNTDEVWRAAKLLADENGLMVAAHMSPHPDDAEWYLANTGKRPLEHLADLGVLGPNTIITHATHVSDSEVKLLAETGTRVAFCPAAALKGAYGVASAGRYPAMRDAGVPILFGTDGDECDFLPAIRLGASVFRDLTEKNESMNALAALETVTCDAAKALGMAADLGSLEAGKKADFLCFDTGHIQWRPLLSPLDHLIWSADGRSLHSVFVDGRRVIENGTSTLVDEEAMLAEVQTAAEEVLARAGLPFQRSWATV